jgi:hypothetical protein
VLVNITLEAHPSDLRAIGRARYHNRPRQQRQLSRPPLDQKQRGAALHIADWLAADGYADRFASQIVNLQMETPTRATWLRNRVGGRKWSRANARCQNQRS